MSTLTPRLGLTKPASTENYSVGIVNANNDIIDSAVGATMDEIDALQAAQLTRDGAYPVTAIPRCRLRQTADQTMATGVPEVLDMATATIDYDWTTAMADKANDRIVIKKAGLYVICLRVVWESNATGTRFALIDKNGSGTQLAEDYRMAAPSSNTIVTLVTEPVALAVNDNIQGRVSQNSGGNLKTTTANGRYSSLSVTYLGPSA